MRFIIGIDEVGRGPLAGPITVAAFGVRSDKWRMKCYKILKGIKDSKQLSQRQRELWRAKLVSESAFYISCVSISPKIIDVKGISFAARHAVAKCLKKISDHSSLSTHHYRVLLDGGLHAPQKYTDQLTIIRGDESEPLIAAASIIAKVTRDRYMTRMHKKYPKYGFASHKGYGTRAHFAAIKKNGLCKIHRESFCTRIIPS